MARNSEKASFLLNRWLSIKEKVAKASFEGRGRYSSTQLTNTIRECESIRYEIMEEISVAARKLRTNKSLDENEIRTINSDINTLLKEKYKWECRIIELCGPNYRSRYNQYIESLGGVSLPDSTLKVFGIAKTLPEYRDIFSSDTEFKDDDKKVQHWTDKSDNFKEEYFREIDPEVEANIVLLEKEKESNLRSYICSEYTENKDLTKTALLDLIKDKEKKIKSSQIC